MKAYRLNVSTRIARVVKAAAFAAFCFFALENASALPCNMPTCCLKSDTLKVVEVYPEFPGGRAELVKYMSENIFYPQEAVDACLQCKFVMQFTVKTDGVIDNISVATASYFFTDMIMNKKFIEIEEVFGSGTSIDVVGEIMTITLTDGEKFVLDLAAPEKHPAAKELEKEAIRVLADMPKWKPAMFQGEPIEVTYTLPVKFLLE